MALVVKSDRTGKSGSLRLLLPSVTAAAVLAVFGAFVAPGFLSLNNLSSIFMSTGLLALMSMAQNTVVIAGDNGIDLSVGAVASMTALLCPVVPMESFDGLLLGVLMAVAVGAFWGAVNGFGVRFLKIPALIMTLIISSVVSGCTMVITKGQPATHISELLQKVSTVVVQPFRVLALIAVVFVVSGELVLLKTRFGRTLRLVGDNPSAAMLSGLNTALAGFLAYVICGAMAGLVGLILVGYAGTTTMTMGNSYTLLSVASVAIGGTSLSGGKGSYVGGALGALVMILLNSILQAWNISQGMRSVVQGALLLVIVIMNIQSAKRRK